MQYLLTEIEYDEMKNRQTILNKKRDDDLQQVCTYAAVNTPIKYWGRTTATPWGCILATLQDDHVDCCDECPVEQQCPNPDKEWSK